MSAPATNARSPAPTSTIARTPSSASRRSISASSSSRSGAESWFIGGFSIVTTATMPSCSVAMNSPTRRSPPAACANCSRSAVLRNFPTAVFGISSTNSNRSGSHHFAKLGREELAQLLRRGVLALAQHDDRERPLRPLLVRDGDDRRLGDRRMAHERVLERDRRDPLAARLDEVLRAVLHLDEAVGMDRDDVAGLEPAVVRPAVGALVRLEVRRGDRRAAHLELAHRLAVPRDEPVGTAGADLDERDRRAPAARGASTPRPSTGRSPGPGAPEIVPTGLISVIPQPWTMCRPCRSPNASIIARGGAAPPTVMNLIDERSQLPGFASSSLQDPHPDRRNAGGHRDLLLDEAVEQRLGIQVRAGEDLLDAGHRARRTGSTRRSRGTSARPEGTRRRRRSRGDASTVSAWIAIARCE